MQVQHDEIGPVGAGAQQAVLTGIPGASLLEFPRPRELQINYGLPAGLDHHRFERYNVLGLCRPPNLSVVHGGERSLRR